MIRDGDFFCGCTNVQAATRTAPWPTDHLPYYLDLPTHLGALEPDDIRAAFKWAWSRWAEQLFIDPIETLNESQALIRIEFKPIDGPSNVLAWSELADGTLTPRQQRYDTQENMVVEEVPDANTIDLARVAAHEIGHVLGLLHDEPNARSLMAPRYNERLRRPTSRDIQRAVALGYRRRGNAPPAAEPPPDRPAPGEAQTLTIKVTGTITGIEIPGYRVER